MLASKRLKSRSVLAMSCLAAASFVLCNGSAKAASPLADSSSSVQLYGLIGVYVDQSKLSTTPHGMVQQGGGGLTTSYWGMRGREDLGNGTAVIFALESFFRPNTGQMGRNPSDGFFARNAYVGLSSVAYGTLKVGQQTTGTYLHQILLNPFGPSVVFSPLIVQSYMAAYNGTAIGDTVWSNTIGYTSPSFAGLTGNVQYGVSDVTGHQGRDNLGLHLTYKNGPLLVALSAQRVRAAAIAPAQQQYLYLGGATYQTRFAKFYGALQTTNTTTLGIGSHTYELGVSVPVSPRASVLAEWALTKQSGPRQKNTVRDTTSIAYDYFFSKRTDVYAAYSYDKLASNPSGSTYGIGMRHRF